MNKKYFGYLLKNRKIALVFFFAIYLGLSFAPFIDAGNGNINEGTAATAFAIAMTLSIVMSFVLPVLQLAFVHNRRSVDMYFALPVSRKEMLITNLVFMFCVLFGFYLVTTTLIWGIFGHAYVRSLNFALILLCGALFILEMLIINSFLYLTANNSFDGIVMLGAYTCLAVLAHGVFSSCLTSIVAGYTMDAFRSGLGAWLSPLYMNSRVFTEVISAVELRRLPSLPVRYMAASAIYALLAAWGLKKNFIERRAERAEQVSDGLFSYPFIINCYCLGILAILGFESVRDGSIRYNLIFYILLLFIYIVATFVYRRKIRLEPKYLAAFAGGMILTLGLAYAGWTTRGFGIADRHELPEGKYIVFDYDARVDRADLGVLQAAESDWNEGVDISFQLDIPADRLDEYAPAVAMMEELRSQSIDDYYQRTEFNGYASMLSVYGKNSRENWQETQRYYYYLHDHLLSEEQLKELAPYVTINIYDDEYMEPFTLQEYLERREK